MFKALNYVKQNILFIHLRIYTQITCINTLKHILCINTHLLYYIYVKFEAISKIKNIYPSFIIAKVGGCTITIQNEKCTESSL